MGSNASLLDLIAHGGSLKATQDNQQQAAQTQGIQANTQLTNTQIPVQQELAKQEAVKTQQAQQQLNDQNILKRGYISAAGLPPDQAADAVRNYAVKNGISAPGFQQFQLHDLDLRNKAATLTKEQRENQDAFHQQAGEILNPIGQIADPVQRQAAYNAALPALQAKAPDLKWPTQIGSDDIPLLQGGLNHATAVLAQAKEKQATQTSAAQADEAAANTKKANIEAGIQQIKLDGLRGANPQQLSASIDQIIDPAKYPAQNLRAKGMANFALQRGDDPSAAVRSVADEIGDIDKKLNPAVRNAGIEDDKKRAAALAPIEIGKAVAEKRLTLPLETQAAVDKETALAKLSPDAFGGIYNPTARNQAMNEYDKIAKERDDKANTSQTLIDTIDAATKGNKVAAGVIPLETVRQFVGRVNKQELAAVSTGAGSALDRVQTWFDKNTTGAPPSWLLSDVRSIADLQKKAADRGFTSGLQRLKARGVDTSKLAAAQPSVAPDSSGGYQAGHVYGGLTFNGGDPNKRENWK